MNIKTYLGLIIVVSIIVFICTVEYDSESYSESENFDRFLQTTNYTITSTRTENFKKYCVGDSSLITDEQIKTNNLYRQSFKSTININGTVIISTGLGGDTATALADVMASITGFILFIGPFLIGLLIILVIWTCLGCCCCCPNCCPSKCCQKNQQEMYTKCQLYWPTIVTILAALLALAASVVGFTNASQVTQSTQQTYCAVSTTFDDLLNGGIVSDSSSFFLGLNTLGTQLTNLQTNIDNIDSDLSNVRSGGTVINSANAAADLALNDISKIPTGVSNGTLTLSYNTPLNAATSTGTIKSLFPDILGNISESSTLVGASYTGISATKSIITSISTSATTFGGSISTFKGSINDVKSSVSSFSTQVSDFDVTAGTFFNSATDYTGIIQKVTQAFYGVTIGFSFLVILGAILMTFCDKYKFRYLMYFSCVILLIIGIIGFLISVLFSLLVPFMALGCQFMDYSLESSANFDNAFSKIISDSKTRSYVSTCLPTSSGDIISVIGGDISGTLDSLTTAVTQLSNFDVTSQTSQINDAFLPVITGISNFKTAKTVDIDDAVSLQILNSIASRTGYSCGVAGWNSDSWVPSNSQTPSQYVACSSSSSGTGNSTTCASANFNTIGSPCEGCMDTYDIFSGQTTQTDVVNKLSSRYGGCATFNTQLSFIWENFYKIKRDSIGPVETRAVTANASVTSFITQLSGSINSTFTTVTNSLQTSVDSITNPKFGLIAGLNCRLIGENIILMKDAFCIPVYNYFYLTRLVLGISSFGILFALCCIVCSGVRHYKHSQKLKNVQPNQNNDTRGKMM